jgi:hypothetical protein
MELYFSYFLIGIFIFISGYIAGLYGFLHSKK